MNITTSNKTGLAGWVIAAALAGVMLGSGFEQSTEKYGVVDLRKVILESKINKEATDKVTATQNAWVALMTFLRDNRVIEETQALKIRQLTLKETKTDAELAELNSTKQAVQNAVKDFERIQTLPQPTEEERQKLMAYNKLFTEWQGLFNRYQLDWQDAMDSLKATVEQDAVDKATKAAAAVAKSKSFTIVFSSNSVAYAANDITADVVKEANK